MNRVFTATSCNKLFHCLLKVYVAAKSQSDSERCHPERDARVQRKISLRVRNDNCFSFAAFASCVRYSELLDVALARNVVRGEIRFFVGYS